MTKIKGVVDKTDLSDIDSYEQTMTTGLIGKKADPKDFIKEINYLMYLYGLPFHRINILIDTADGENWVYIDNHWYGDLDEWFYECMENNLTKEVYFENEY